MRDSWRQLSRDRNFRRAHNLIIIDGGGGGVDGGVAQDGGHTPAHRLTETCSLDL